MKINNNEELNKLLQEQLAYYRARAVEYDEWFLRKGRYDRGPEFNQQWLTEVQEVADALSDFDPKGRVLEIACGTGIWTERLINFAEGITALDASPEMLAINRARVGKARVRYIKADIFSKEVIVLWRIQIRAGMRPFLENGRLKFIQTWAVAIGENVG